MRYWLVKQEPEDYSWADFCKDRKTSWTGVRNFQARNNLRSMAKGDLVLYYHSGDEKQIVGIAKVLRPAYPDPTAKEGDWVAVDLAPLCPLRKPVTLVEIKSNPALRDLPLLRQTRLSVVEIPAKHFEILGGSP